MGHSFGGIGQWAATFACNGAVQEGQVVQIRDIILGETKVPVENISMVSVK